MNRQGLKQASRQSIADTESKPVLTTLIYLIITYCILALSTFILPVGALPDLVYSDADAYVLSVINRFFAPRYMATSLLSYLINLLLQVFSTGYEGYCLKLSRRTATGVNDIFAAINIAGKVIWLTILIWFFTTLWSMLFVIPGVVAAYRYRMAYFALLDNPELTAREALNVSKRITKGHKFDLFVLDLSFIGWYLLAAFTLGIVLIWKLPYIITTYAHAYNSLIGDGFKPNNQWTVEL